MGILRQRNNPLDSQAKRPSHLQCFFFFFSEYRKRFHNMFLKHNKNRREDRRQKIGEDKRMLFDIDK